jgi:hypothetical protein
MNSLILSSLLAVLLGVALIGGVSYIYPAQGQLRSIDAAPVFAGYGAKGSAQVVSPQTLGSLGGNQSSLAQLLAVIGGSSILGAAVSIISRRAG